MMNLAFFLEIMIVENQLALVPAAEDSVASSKEIDI